MVTVADHVDLLKIRRTTSTPVNHVNANVRITNISVLVEIGESLTGKGVSNVQVRNGGLLIIIIVESSIGE